MNHTASLHGRFLVFAGAGASAAVDANQFPTTAAFYEQLEIHPNDPRSLLGHVAHFLERGLTPGGVADVEQLLWELTRLGDWLDQIQREDSIQRYMIQESRMAQITGQGHALHEFLATVNSARPIVSKLIASINQQIFTLYGRQPTLTQLEPNWIELLSALSDRTESTPGCLDLFTTNYDLVIETALDALATQGMGQTGSIDMGRVSGFRTLMNFDRWTLPRSQKSRGLLTKLHGSVDWSRSINDDAVYAGDSSFKGSDDRHLVLYPGFKGVPATEPFKKLHEYFGNALRETTRALFIGFAFRDQHINDLIRTHFPPAAKAVVLNPAEVDLSNFPAGFSQVRARFDRKGIDEALRTLLSSN